jgi:hypothetical protein
LDYKPLLAQLITERERLDRAISVLQALDQEQSLDLIASAAPTRGRGRPLGSRNKPRVATIDPRQDSNSNLRDSAVTFSQSQSG